MMTGGLFGFVMLVLDVWAILNVAQSGVDTPKKVGWIVLIIFLPPIGFLIWAFAGPRERK